MDENYLDGLLNDVSSKNKKNNSFDNVVNMDAGIDIDVSDLDNISLEELDGFDELDLGDLDIDDIDFDDLDITNLNASKTVASEEEKQEDFNLDSLLTEPEDNYFDREIPDEEEHEDNSQTISDLLDSILSDDEQVDMNQEDMSSSFVQNDLGDMSALFGEESAPAEPTYSSTQAESAGSGEEIDLDDLFSALGIEDEEHNEAHSYTSGESDLDALLMSTTEFSMEDGTLDDILDIGEVQGKKKGKSSKSTDKKKKTFSEILFGEPDADDLEEEKLLAIQKAKKEEKKEQKKVEKEAKAAAKKETLELKKKEEKAKQDAKLKKKQMKEEALRLELEEEKNEKKVSNPTVIIVFTLFIALAVLVIFGTKHFNYTQVIKKAADYFERHRYRLAYDEVSGVEVKEEDEELRDRIYTVMYVERLYESYENNMTLGRPDKALDALIRGLEKYDTHYEEAVELNVVEDIDLCKAKIIDALDKVFNLTEADAYEIMSLEGQEYSQTLIKYSGVSDTGE